MSGPNGGPIQTATSIDVALSSLSDAELEKIERREIEQGELAIEGELLPALTNGDGRLRLPGPDADEPTAYPRDDARRCRC